MKPLDTVTMTPQRPCEPTIDELLGTIRDDPLSPRLADHVRRLVEASCPTCDIARAIYGGLEGALATYWVILQEGKLLKDDSEFYRVVGMLRYVRTCHQDRDRLLAFLEEDADFFEMLGRMTSWAH